MNSLTPPKSRCIARFQRFIHRHWQPKPIEKPKADPDTPNLTGVQRSAETIRYSLLSLEWWLSPNGTLREWFKINSKVGSILLIPAVLVLPLVTLILFLISTCMAFLVSICGNLILLPLGMVVIVGILFIIRSILGK